MDCYYIIIDHLLDSGLYFIQLLPLLFTQIFSDKGRFNPINKCVYIYFIKEIVIQTGPGSQGSLELKLRAVSSSLHLWLDSKLCNTFINHKHFLINKDHQVDVSACRLPNQQSSFYRV